MKNKVTYEHFVESILANTFFPFRFESFAHTHTHFIFSWKICICNATIQLHSVCFPMNKKIFFFVHESNDFPHMSNQMSPNLSFKLQENSSSLYTHAIGLVSLVYNLIFKDNCEMLPTTAAAAVENHTLHMVSGAKLFNSGIDVSKPI